MLEEAEEIIGHNIIKFDIPAIQKVYPTFSPSSIKVTDTLVCSRVIWPNLKDRDFNFRKKHPEFPGNKIGSHGLEAWGHRLGEMKGDYAKERKAKAKELGITDKAELDDFVWGQWNPEMQAYCEQDVEVTEWLLNKIIEKNFSQEALDLEHEVATEMWAVEQRGFGLDMPASLALVEELQKRRALLETELQTVFLPWWKDEGEVTPKRTANYKDVLRGSVTKGAPYTKVSLEVFNAGSRQHIANRLTAIHGWKPQQFTESGQVKIDETILAELKYPQAAILTEYLTIQKRIGQVAEGAKAWLNLVSEDGRIHAGYNTNGAVTSRATHMNPNIGQVPKVKHSADGEMLYGYKGGWGAECRGLFVAKDGNVIVGCDLSGIQLRCLGHYMARFDDGEYLKVILEGDPHEANRIAAGLPSRDTAKTFI